MKDTNLKLSLKPVAWRREWDGDESDLGTYIYSDEKPDLSDHSEGWEPLYDQPVTIPKFKGSIEGVLAQAEAWEAICAALDKVDPIWHDRGETGIESAIASIMYLAVKDKT